MHSLHLEKPAQPAQHDTQTIVDSKKMGRLGSKNNMDREPISKVSKEDGQNPHVSLQKHDGQSNWQYLSK